MFGKIIAGIVMGILVAILAGMLVGLVSGGGGGGGKASNWGMLAGFVLTLVLAITAARPRFAWGCGSILAGLMCLALPLAGIVFTGVVASAVSQAESDSASQAGAAIGAGLAGTMITGVLAVVGFFAGVIFLVIAYFSMREPRGSNAN